MQNEIQIMMGGFDNGRTPHVQQYDAASRVYICRLWERPGVPFRMADNAIVGAVFKWRRVTGSHEYETEILDSSTVKVKVPAAAMQLPGQVEMQLVIHQEGGVLHSPVLCFMAMRSLKPADKETDEPAMLLVALVAKTQELFDRAEPIIQGASDAANAANDAAQRANKAAEEMETILQPRGANQHLKTDAGNNIVWGDKIYWVNATVSGTACTVDKTLAQIVKAYNEQETVICRMTKDGAQVLMPLTKIAAGTLAAFAVMMNGMLATVTVMAGGAEYTEEAVAGGGANEPLTFTGAVNKTYDGREAVSVPIPKVPDALKNPKALKFTGAVSKTYNGESEVEVPIPTVPSTLKNPYALTFTGAAKETYDGSKAVSVHIPTDALPDYWQQHMDVRVPEIRAAMTEAGYDKSAFLFWNDAHWTYAHHSAPALLKYLYKHTPINKTAFGGDIIDGEGEGQATDMEYLWDWRDMLRDLPNHHSVPGNHDDGETVDNRFDDAYIYAYLLAAEETPQVMRGSEGLYYYMDEPSEKTRYLYLDTATKDGDFYVNTHQIDWLKETLISTPDGWHIVAIAHKWQEVNRNVDPAQATGFDFGGKLVLEMLDSYNQRRGDYARCNGWVEFCVGGHTHVDGDYMSAGGIPVILTQTASRYSRDSTLPPTEGTTNETAVSAIVGNYTDNKVDVIRVGRGSSRTVALTEWVRADNPLPPVWPEEAGYTNVLKAAGYKENRRFSTSSFVEVPAYGWDLTGMIAAKKGDVLRFRNMTWFPSAENEGRSAVYWFDADGNYLTNSTINTAEQMASWSPVYDAKGNVLQVTLPVTSDVAYIRICCQELSETSVITVNEPTETCNNVLWEAGFEENMRYSDTSHTYVEAKGWDLTGYIAAGKGSVLRMKNMQMLDLYGTGGATNRSMVYWYDANKNFLTLSDNTMMDSSWSPVYNEEGDVVQFTLPQSMGSEVQYIRICAKNVTKDSIITVDEEIK